MPPLFFHPGMVLLWNYSNMLRSPAHISEMDENFFCAVNIVYDLRVLCGKRIYLELSQKLFMIKGAI